MAERELAEIQQIVESLEKDMSDLVKEAHSRYELYSMRQDEDLPNHMIRTGKVRVPSPMIIHAVSSLRSDMMMNPTEITVVPLGAGPDGTVSKAEREMADYLEKGSAVLWGRLNEGREVDANIIWHQLASPFGVMILRCEDVDLPGMTEDPKENKKRIDEWERRRFNWSIETPDPLTCFFPILGAAKQPRVFARHYKQLIADVEQTYSRRRGEFRNVDWRVGRNGQFDYVKVSDDEPPTESYYRNGRDMFQECEMLELDDGDMLYHVALNLVAKDQKPGANGAVLLWSGRNLTGGCSAVVVPGNPTPLRRPEDHFEPFLWPLFQQIKNINRVRAMRATTSQNVTHPMATIPLSPEVIKARSDAGLQGLPDPLIWEEGSSQAPYTWGEAKAWPMGEDANLDKLEKSFWDELPRYMVSTLELNDPQILKETTATAFVHVAEARARQLGPMISLYDRGIGEILKKVFYTIRHEYKDDFWYYAQGGERSHGRTIGTGAAFKIGPEELDFQFNMIVKTSSMTAAQAHALFSSWTEKYMWGVATREEGLDAADYTDKEGQLQRLTEEAMVEEVTPFIDQMVTAATVERVRLRSGILLPMGPSMPPAPSGGNPNAGNQTVTLPAASGPAGGTNPLGGA